MNISADLELSLSDVIGQHIALLGTTGQGKSTTAKVLIEELLAADPTIPITVIDRDGEYWPLAQIGSFIRVGQGENADLECDIDHVEELARYSVEHGVSIILSLKHLRRKDGRAYAARYLEALWEAISHRTQPRPYMLFVEEAQELAPEQGTSEAKELLGEIATRGRKLGLTMIVASQRAAKIDKDVISQASIRFFHRAAYANDVAVYADNTPDWMPAQVRKANAALVKGQAIVIINNSVQIAQMRQSSVYDAGASPSLQPGEEMPVLQRVGSEMLTELRDLFKTSLTRDAATGLEADALQRKIAALEDEKAAMQAEIDRLNAELLKRDGAPAGNAVAVMPVGTINAEKIVAPVIEAPSPAGDQPVSRIIELDAERRKRRANDLGASRKMKRFEKLLNDMDRNVSAMWKTAYAFLLETEGQWIKLHQLGRKLGYSDATMNRRPAFLLEQGLLQRSGTKTSNMQYRSITKEMLAEQFPDMDIDAMYCEIVKAVTPRQRA